MLTPDYSLNKKNKKVNKMHKNLILPVLASFARSAGQTIERDAKLGNSCYNYLLFQAHPDDEIVIAGLVSRLARFAKNPVFLALTDGNCNTEQNRVYELNASYRALGWKNGVRCLGGEDAILYHLATPNRETDRVSPLNKEEVHSESIRGGARVIRTHIDQLEKISQDSNTDIIFANEYAGAHIVHDIINMIAVLAAKRVRKTRPIDVYEFPQHFTKLKTDTPIETSELRELVRRLENPETRSLPETQILQDRLVGVRNSKLGDFVYYSLGTPLASKNHVSLTDPGIGIYDSTIRLTLGEMIRKLRAKSCHKSQGKSLNRLSSFAINPGDFSREELRYVPADRDFSIAPTNLVAYELASWRYYNASFSTFARVYEEIMSKE